MTSAGTSVGQVGRRHPDRQLEADAGRAGAADQLLRRALGDESAGHQHADAVGEVLGLIEVVRRQQHGGPARAEFADQLPGLAAGRRVEPGGRLVEEQQVGRGRRCPWPGRAGVAARRRGDRRAGRAAASARRARRPPPPGGAGGSRSRRSSTASATVSSCSTPDVCRTMPMRSRRSRPARAGSWPRTVTSPDVLARWPSRISTVVDLPAPLWPSRA